MWSSYFASLQLLWQRKISIYSKSTFEEYRESKKYVWDLSMRQHITQKLHNRWLLHSICFFKIIRYLKYTRLFKNYFFIYEHLHCTLQNNSHQIFYTWANVFSNPWRTSKIIFCVLVQLHLRWRIHLLNRSVMSFFHVIFSFRDTKKS